jgi:single-stranded-DNA-specific exonuclease
LPHLTGGKILTTEHIWKEVQPAGSDAQSLARELQCPAWISAFLISSGISNAKTASAWLHPQLKSLGDPFDLPDMAVAVDRILQAIVKKERVTIFGDYDVDGLTSVALLSSLLKPSGVSISTFLPHRLEEGYGLSTDALARCLEETHPDLIVTVDCGTSSVTAVVEARRLGVDVIITDHHSITPELAPAVAVVNPRRSPDENLHVLSGVGVAFKLAHAILKRARQTMGEQSWTQFDPKELLEYVALGTIADLVPLTGENRILVHHGLRALNQTRKIGIRALIDVAKISGPIDTYEVGYLLGPRLNASGRLGTAQTSLKLLMTTDTADARICAGELDAANRERQQVERSIVEELATVTDARLTAQECYSIVEAREHWHPGVVGIAASRMVQKHGRPAIVIGIDDQGRAKGSCRSVSGFNLVEALSECGDLLVKFGGHAMAAGVEIEWNNVEAFKERFEKVAKTHLTGRQWTPTITIDGWISLRDIDEHVLQLLDQLRPFGIGYPEPLWACRGMAVSGSAREVGKGHLKVRLSGQGVVMDTIGFGLYAKGLPNGPLDAAFHLRKETFRGIENLVMHLKDFRPSV